MKIFLDVDDLDDISKLEEYIDATNVIIIFMSRGYFVSANCLREMRAAKQLGKPIVLVHEADEGKGGESLDAMKRECPADLREFIFGSTDLEASSSESPSQREIVQWHRVTPFQISALLRIAAGVIQLCLAASKGSEKSAERPSADQTIGTTEGVAGKELSKEPSSKRRVTANKASSAKPGRLYLPGAVTEETCVVPDNILVYVSPNNQGAMARMTELCPPESAVRLTTKVASLKPGATEKVAHT